LARHETLATVWNKPKRRHTGVDRFSILSCDKNAARILRKNKKIACSSRLISPVGGEKCKKKNPTLGKHLEQLCENNLEKYSTVSP